MTTSEMTRGLPAPPMKALEQRIHNLANLLDELAAERAELRDLYEMGAADAYEDAAQAVRDLLGGLYPDPGLMTADESARLCERAVGQGVAP